MQKYIIMFSLLTVMSVNIFSSSDPHDSLLFDSGSFSLVETYFSKSNENCEFRVIYVKGNATGKIKKMQIFDECGIDTIYEYVNGALEKYSVIQPGEMVKTGPESSAKIEFPDGSEIVLGSNTTYTLPVNACDVMSRGVLESGSLWTKIKKLIGGGKFEVSTERAVHGVRGTEFTIQVLEENGSKYDVLKVYEGSVEVSLKSIDTKNIETKGEEFTKLSEDLQAGRITIEEFTIKSQGFSEALNEASKIKLNQFVEAGYFLKTDGKSLGEPQTFNSSENKWFEIDQ